MVWWWWGVLICCPRIYYLLKNPPRKIKSIVPSKGNTGITIFAFFGVLKLIVYSNHALGMQLKLPWLRCARGRGLFAATVNCSALKKLCRPLGYFMLPLIELKRIM